MKALHLSILFFFFVGSVFAQLSGRVVAISDGDTFTLLTADKKQIKIRLHGVDCPEKNQAFGNRAKEFTSKMIFNKMVTVTEKKKDRYKRTLGVVFVGNACLNEALLKTGFAWHYKAYDKNPAWAKYEVEARRGRLGLWADKNPTPPWEFRKDRRKN